MYLTEPPADTARPAVPLRQSVNAGEIALHPEAGERLTKLFTTQIDQAEEWLKRIERLSRPAALGTNVVGRAMSAKFEQRAKGDETNSFYSTVQAYREVLEQTRDAVRSAIRNYRMVDDDQAKAFRTQVI
jgi:hypothetical protein